MCVCHNRHMHQQHNTVQKILSQFKGKEKQLKYFLAGFADGESSFSVAIIKTSMHKSGWMINPCFQVYQHEQHREILEVFQAVLKTGSIYRKSGIHPVLNFSVDSMRNLKEKVIPFFDKYPLIVKRETYQKFRTILMMVDRKEHLHRQGFTKIVELAYTMNQQGKGRKHTKEFILNSLPADY